MKKVFMVVSLIAVLVFATIAFAYDGWSTGTIAGVRHRAGNVTLVIQNTPSNPCGCAGGTAYLQLNEDGSELAKRINADIAIAIATGKPISFEITGCSGGGTAGYPVITASWLKDQ